MSACSYILKQSSVALRSPNLAVSPKSFTTNSITRPVQNPPANRLAVLSRQFSSSGINMAPVKQEYDMIVIGGGSGGSGTARRASGWYKAKTCIVDDGISGGCCVNVGCVPKKMTLNMASINTAVKEGKHYGYNFGDVTFDFKTFVEKRSARIKVLNSIYEKNWGNDGIDLIHGKATFVNAHELEITPKDGSDKYNIRGKHITIATGSYPTKPSGIKGSDYGITSDDFFSIEYLPKKMVFVGAGYIAVELAGVMNALGVETHLFIRGDTFLRKFDKMVQDIVTQHYEDEGVIIHKKHPGIKEVIELNPAKDITDPREKELKLIMNDGKEMVTNELLWAIGRGAETRGLGIDKAGIKIDETGHVVVDKYQNTNVDGIYALGDITGQAELTPVAIKAGRLLSARLFGPPEMKDSHLDYSKIPSVIFSHPEIGTMGLTEEAAKEKYGEEKIKVYSTKFSAMYFDVFPPEEKKKNPTAMKIVCLKPEEKIVGLHILGKGCDEMMQGFGVVLAMGGTKKDLDACVAIHPTSAEELVTMT